MRGEGGGMRAKVVPRFCCKPSGTHFSPPSSSPGRSPAGRRGVGSDCLEGLKNIPDLKGFWLRSGAYSAEGRGVIPSLRRGLHQEKCRRGGHKASPARRRAGRGPGVATRREGGAGHACESRRWAGRRGASTARRGRSGWRVALWGAGCRGSLCVLGVCPSSETYPQVTRLNVWLQGVLPPCASFPSCQRPLCVSPCTA